MPKHHHLAGLGAAGHARGDRSRRPPVGVDTVVEGSVLRQGNQVRITAQLIDAKTDHHLWARSYVRDLNDVLTLQAEVARTIADQIRIAVTPEERARLARPRTVDRKPRSSICRARKP